MITKIWKSLRGRANRGLATRAKSGKYTTNQLTALVQAIADVSYGGHPFCKSPIVNLATRRLGESLMQVELRVSKDKRNRGEKIIEDGELWNLIQRPNERDQTWSKFVERTVHNMILEGGNRWLLLNARGAAALPAEVMAVPQDKVKTKTAVDEFGFKRPVYHEFVSEGTGRRIPYRDEEVVAVNLPNPLNPIQGLSPLDAGSQSVQQDIAASKWNTSLFKNGAEPGGILKTDQSLTTEQAREILDAWLDRFAGEGKANSTAVMHSGLAYEAVSRSHKDMEFTEQRKWSRDEIGTLLGAFPILYGVVENANRSNSDTQEILWWTITIMPLAFRIAEAFTQGIARRFDPQVECWFDFRQVPVLQKRHLESVEMAKLWWDMGYPVNDINALLDWGLPDTKIGKRSLVPFNLQTAEQLLGEDVEEINEPEGVNSETPEEDADGEGSKSIRSAIDKAAPTESQRTAIWQQFNASWSPLAKVAERKFITYFQKQRDGVLKRLATFKFPDEGKSKSVVTRGTIDRLLAEVLFDLEPEDLSFKVIAQSVWREAAQLGGEQAVEEAGGIAEDFRVDDKAIARLFRQRENKIRDVNKSTFKFLIREMKKGLSEGETAEKIADRVRGVYRQNIGHRKGKVVTPGRALRIARTEVHNVVSGSRKVGFVQAGVDGKSWLTARAGDIRDTHRAAEAATLNNPIGIHEKFQVGADRLDYPGDPSGSAKEIINCRCVVLARRKNESSKAMWNRYGGWKFRAWIDSSLRAAA
jgi:HK97 family phage portal protein